MMRLRLTHTLVVHTVVVHTVVVHSVVVFLAVCSPVAAQGRIYVAVNGMYQATSHDFGETFTFTENAEQARVEIESSADSGPGFDVSGGVRLSRHFGVGVGVTRFSRTTPASIEASVPHPFFFEQPRTVTADVSGLKREELAVHIQVRALVPIGRQLELSAFGGPSFYTVRQGVVTDIEYTESYPFDAVTFDRAVTTSAEKSKAGFNVGADLAYFFTRQLGVGGGLQYSPATVKLGTAAGRTISVDAGGLQVGGGVRLRF
jgi:hypothetical protein